MHGSDETASTDRSMDGDGDGATTATTSPGETVGGAPHYGELPDVEPVSEPASRCPACGRVANRRGICPDPGCPGGSGE